MPKEQELIARIKELESELARTKKQKRYGLVWEDKKEDVVERCKHELPVLLADESKTLSDNPNWPTNILIEWDNFHALSVLAYTHDKKVDVIYIDPPYNTGNKSWRYNNDYVELDDAYRHSKWVSMLERRIQLAKQLLSDWWIIVCAIDDYETHNVRMMFDDIFWETNRLWTACVVHNPGWRQDEQFFPTAHEYMYVYTNNIERCELWRLEISEEKRGQYSNKDEHWKYKLRWFRRSGANSKRTDRPNLFYPIYLDEETLALSIENTKWTIELLPIDDDGVERCWRWNAKSFTEKKDQYIETKIIKGKYSLQVKEREDDNVWEKPKTLWNNPKYSAVNWTNLLKKIFNKEKIFDYPKSLYLLLDIVKIVSKENSIILDFFAWSGTTGHAVLELNKEDGGNRQFILCTNNENKIAEEVTYPRIRNVIKWYADVEGIPANLRYYRTNFISNDKSIDDLRHKFILRCSEMLQIRESCFDVSALNGDEYFQVFENKDLVLAILYHPYEIKRLREIISQTEKPIVAYIFSMGMEIFQEELAEYGDKVRIETVPDEILETYKKIFGF